MLKKLEIKLKFCSAHCTILNKKISCKKHLRYLRYFGREPKKGFFEKKRVKVLKDENMHLKLILRIITKEIEYKLGIKYI